MVIILWISVWLVKVIVVSEEIRIECLGGNWGRREMKERWIVDWDLERRLGGERFRWELVRCKIIMRIVGYVRVMFWISNVFVEG